MDWERLTTSGRVVYVLVFIAITYIAACIVIPTGFGIAYEVFQGFGLTNDTRAIYPK